MKYLLITLFVILLSGMIWAQVPYYPLTSIAEDFASTSCTSCLNTFAGLNVVESQTNTNNFFSVRYYAQSGLDWTFPAVEERLSYYQVIGVPSAVFNGKDLIGGGSDVSDGVTYLNTLSPYKWSSSPVKMEVLAFDHNTLNVQIKVTMFDSTYVMTDAPICFLLLQDNVTPVHTHAVRDIKMDIVNLTGNGNTVQFTKTFTPSMTINPDSLWVAAFIQTGDHTILQSVSSKPKPDYYSRIILPFKQNLHGDLDVYYQSIPFYVWNFGNPGNFTIKLVKDDAPDSLELAFCSTSGSCYGQNVAVPFNLGSDAYRGFFVDVTPHVSGIAHFHFEITQINTGTQEIIPFSFATSDVANNDHFAQSSLSSTISNSPNPFREQTKLTYRIESKNAVNASLEIYNIKGQIVKRFSHLSLNNGEGSLNWNGRGNDGKTLPSGIYFSRLKGVPGSKTHKIVIFR